MFIILDRDDEINDMQSYVAVRVLQWQRRSIEKYLLDMDVLTEFLKDGWSKLRECLQDSRTRPHSVRRY